MLTRTLIIVLLAFGLSGCATTRQPTPLNNLQIRVAQVESILDKKDQEIEDLRFQINTLKKQIGSIEEYQMNEPAEEYVEPNKKISSKTFKSDGNIIRVQVNPKEVQQALKNAGFYSGDIDGKVGAMTKQAIKDFQDENNLKVDGILGARTWDELKDYLK